MSIREAAVAGSFYPGEREKLLAQLRGFFKGLAKDAGSSCVVAPHAGYIYSGKTAAYSFNAWGTADTFVILSPNHTGLGEIISVSDADCWETPLGKIAVDASLRETLLKKLGISADDLAHIQEHSIEVQLPFIQFLFPDAKILPITLMCHDLPTLEKLGNALYEICRGKSIGIIASSDFSHFIPEKSAKEIDARAIKLIEKLDLGGFHSLVTGRGLSICGFAAIIAAMAFCRKAGIKQGKLLKYDTSATATGDRGNVVGYAAIKFG